MKISNKRARFEYELTERLETGVVLNGGEAKAVRGGRIDISRSFAKIIGQELYLINANIPVAGKKDYNSTRSRKLLAHKNEILALETKAKQQKLTIVPVSMYNKGRLIKVELALGKPKRKFEKKESIKRRDIERELAREARGPKE